MEMRETWNNILNRLNVSGTENKQDNIVSITYAVEALGAERTIKLNKFKNYVQVITKTLDIAPRPDTVANVIQLLARINDLIQIGCLEFNPDLNELRFKNGQIIHNSSDPVPLLEYFIKYHDFIFPRMMESIKEVTISGKLPVEAASTFFNAYEEKKAN